MNIKKIIREEINDLDWLINITPTKWDYFEDLIKNIPVININKNIVEFSRVFGYGSRSISKGIYLFLNQHNYLVIDNYNLLKYLIILSYSIIT